MTVRYIRENHDNPGVNQTPEYIDARKQIIEALKFSKIVAPKIDYKLPDSFKKSLIDKNSHLLSEIRLNLSSISETLNEIYKSIDLSNLNINTKMDLVCRIFLPLEPSRNGSLEEQIIVNIKNQLNDELEIFNSVEVIFEYQNNEYVVNIDDNQKVNQAYILKISEQVIEFDNDLIDRILNKII